LGSDPPSGHLWRALTSIRLQSRGRSFEAFGRNTDFYIDTGRAWHRDPPGSGAAQVCTRATRTLTGWASRGPSTNPPFGQTGENSPGRDKLCLGGGPHADGAFNCVDGTRGLGQIYTDGSAMATIQVSGSGPARTLGFPPGTLKVKGEAVCATLKGLSFEPCFNLNRTGEQSFRGSLRGLGSFAYCDFERRVSSASVKEQQAH